MRGKLVVVVLVGIIAFAGGASGYTYLFGDLTVSRGCSYPKIKFISVTTGDNEFEDGVVDPKDVGDVCACICCGKKIKTCITNGYPGYEAYYNFTIQNQGGRRVHIDEVYIEDYDTEAIEIVMSDLVCRWICPCGTINGELVVRIFQEAAQDHQYSFSMGIRASRAPEMRPRPFWFWKQEFEKALGIRGGIPYVLAEELEQYLDQITSSSQVYSFTGTQKEKFELAVTILTWAGSHHVESRLRGKLLALWLNYVSGRTACLEIQGLTAYEVIQGSEYALVHNLRGEYRYWMTLCHQFNYYRCA